MRTTKPKAPKKFRKPKISVSFHHFPVFDKVTWLFADHVERTKMTLTYIREFDKMNGFAPGNSYTFGGVTV